MQAVGQGQSDGAEIRLDVAPDSEELYMMYSRVLFYIYHLSNFSYSHKGIRPQEYIYELFI